MAGVDWTESTMNAAGTKLHVARAGHGHPAGRVICWGSGQAEVAIPKEKFVAIAAASQPAVRPDAPDAFV